MLSQCAKTAEHGVRTRPGRKLQIHWRDEIVERRKVAVVQPQFAQELPDSLDRIELRAVGRKEKQDELGLLLSAPLGMHGGVVIPGVVHDNEHSPTSMPTASAQLAQEGPACLGIKTAFGLGDHQTSVTYPHRAEVADAFARGRVPTYRIANLGSDPHTTAAAMLLEMDFVHRPQIDFIPGGEALEFFFTAACACGSA